MKLEKDIREELEITEKRLKQLIIEYCNLDQIAACDAPGKNLSTKIENYKGRLDALKFVLS